MNYTANDRFKDTLNSTPKDRVPVFGAISLWAASNFPNATYQEIACDPGLIASSQLWGKDLIAFDVLSPSPDPLFVAEAFGCDIQFPETGPIVDALPLKIGSASDIEKIYFPNHRKDGRFPVVLEAAQMLSKETGGRVPIMGILEGAFTNTCRVIEVEQIMRMAFKTPQILDALLDKMNKLLIDFALALVENGVNTLFIPEPTASPAMISPKMFRRFVLPHIQDFTNQMNVPVMLHICGDTAHILDDMGKSGAEILSLDQCMDLARSREVVPGKVIAGNVDPIISLVLGDVETVEQDTLHCLRTMGTERFILMPGCGIPPNAPVENLKAMVRVASDYGLGQ